MKKAQASLDFLLTYAWALLLIILVVAALFALGVFDPISLAGNTVSGFNSLGIVGYSLYSNGSLGIQFENHFGRNIEITNISATFKNETITWNGSLEVPIGKQTPKLYYGEFSKTPKPGDSYTMQVEVSFLDLDNDWTYKDRGTLVGKVQ